MTWQSAIKDRMDKYEMTQTDLVEKSGLSKSYISELVRGQKTGLSLDTADIVAKALNTRGWVLWREACK